MGAEWKRVRIYICEANMELEGGEMMKSLQSTRAASIED